MNRPLYTKMHITTFVNPSIKREKKKKKREKNKKLLRKTIKKILSIRNIMQVPKPVDFQLHLQDFICQSFSHIFSVYFPLLVL